VPLRCTQNPTIGEEWRRGWHPQRIPARESGKRILIVGAGPAGLEAALALGQRGYEVALAERGRELGGRLLRDSALPGLSTWIRVRDHRQLLLERLSSVSIYRESALAAPDILDFGADQVVIATGSRWRRDGIGTAREEPVPLDPDAVVHTPDDLDGFQGPVLIYDDENYYMGGALAEQLRRQGHDVTYVTSQPVVSAWTQMTDEQGFVQQRLLDLGVRLFVSHVLQAVAKGHATFAYALSASPVTMTFGSIVLVTGRQPVDDLYKELVQHAAAPAVARIGDCFSPGPVADAIYAGHRFAREFDMSAAAALRRERPDP
jgi:dimethylamine/trimethylamine dehydrogenase